MLALVGDAYAQDVELQDVTRNPMIGNYKGYAEFKMAHYDTARAIWEALDGIDYAEGAFNLGILYEEGLGVAKDMSRALAYYERAAKLGGVRAAFRLGKIYWFGTPSVPQDKDKGRQFLTLAAQGGDSEAASYLNAAAPVGSPLAAADAAEAKGQLAEAASILLAAASAGDRAAQTRIAWYYEAGKGVTRDLAAAARWFGQAAAAGDGEAMYALAVMHRTGAGMPEDHAKSADWLRRSAAAGYVPAQRELKQAAAK
ncbi:MAG TPA: tetratricopeptide repeat protein [Rhodocyclaceae bacterium]